MSCGVCLDLQGCFNSFIYSSFFSSLCYSLELPTEIKAPLMQNAGGAIPGWSRACERQLQQGLFLYQDSRPAGQIPDKQIEIPTLKKLKKKKKGREKSPSCLIHSRVASGTCVEGRLDLRGDFICFPLLSTCSKESL